MAATLPDIFDTFRRRLAGAIIAAARERASTAGPPVDVMVRSFDGTVLAHFSLASAEQLLRLRDAVRPYGCSAIHMDASSCDFALDRRAANHREQHPGRRAADKKRTLPEHR